MEIKFSEIPEDTKLAQEYLQKNEEWTELLNNFNETVKKYSPYIYDGKAFDKNSSSYRFDGKQYDKVGSKDETPYKSDENALRNLASSLKQNASLIAQLEYKVRNKPIADTNEQLNLLVQNLKSRSPAVIYNKDLSSHVRFLSNDPLLVFGCVVDMICHSGYSNTLISECKETAPLCQLFVKLCYEAGFKDIIVVFGGHLFSEVPEYWSRKREIRGLDSGTLAVVAEDADVDSAVDKFLATSKEAPWRLRKILVQESVYKNFKDALRWKCNLHKSGSEPPQSSVLCSESLSYGGRMFLIDPVVPTEEQPGVVPVEAYRTAKEMISLVQQDRTRYLSLWANGVAEVNEVTHATRAPVLWVNSIADFRGPPQVSEAVYSHIFDQELSVKKDAQIAKLINLSQSWSKLDLNSRRDVLNGVLDIVIEKYDPTSFTKDVKYALTDCTMKSFFDVGQDYVCMGISQAVGILGVYFEGNAITLENMKSLLRGNALILYDRRANNVSLEEFENAGVPYIYVGKHEEGDFKVIRSSLSDTRTRVVWSNMGTIFAN
ncbi:uncharacterized protein LOC124637935 [Helicoverpa zea]|uniref:uncharacterized protein LOC124637935 n=1 Tax=Helicoverpa zea TaxID=7113 RepID=UPI001F59C286|nr:uncharacterized protein LOC124637935 [Helicoverpa zea]